jgi:hypothetical protein
MTTNKNTNNHGSTTRKLPVSFFLLLLYKIRKQEGRTCPPWRGWYQWEGEEVWRW